MLSEFQTGLVDSYDQVFRSMNFYFEDFPESGFANLGFFLPGTPNHKAACENMMERLLGLIRRKKGLILDVGCGIGGPAHHIVRHYPAKQVHGINISKYQLDQCRLRIPESHFYQMAAERLAFQDGSFDVVISIEAAPHFKGRREFLGEARRVLKPGGELVVADMLFNSQPQGFRRVLKGQELYQNIGEYRELWEAGGFRDVSCEDVTTPVWKGFVEHTKSRALRELITHTMDAATFRRLIKFAKKIEALPVAAYVLAHGWKPE